MIIKKKAKDSLTAVEISKGDIFEFTLLNGDIWKMELLNTSAEIIYTNLRQIKAEEETGRTNYRFYCDISINGKEYRLKRVVSTQESFYEPWVIDGVRIWFDAVDDIFNILAEAHGECRPAKQARFAVQESNLRICLEKLNPLCPLPEGGLKIGMCYGGEDCWLGAYQGASAHNGLDINHPKGTPIWAPLDIHDHFLFNSLKKGHNNNRWRGIHKWDNGSEWIIQVHHIYELLAKEHEPVKKGTHIAKGAVLSG